MVGEVDLLIARPASCMTGVHQDSPLRATYCTLPSPATALIGIGQGLMVPSLMSAALPTCARNGPALRPAC